MTGAIVVTGNNEEAAGISAEEPVAEQAADSLINESVAKVEKTSTCSLITRYSGVFTMQGFRLKSTDEAIVVVTLGNLAALEAPLVRVHSRCVTGEVFGSVQCDCGQQLELSFERIRAEGAGMIIYLEQEGRGCGLIAKLKGHELMETEGLDTVDAYIKQNLPWDNRSYDAAIRVLEFLGVHRVRLLTNNPEKIKALSEAGIEVAREPLEVPPNPWSRDYLRTKKLRMGHLLNNI